MMISLAVTVDPRLTSFPMSFQPGVPSANRSSRSGSSEKVMRRSVLASNSSSSRGDVSIDW